MTRFWTLSLRVRLMVIGVFGVAIALLVGGVAFYSALTLAVNRGLDNDALATGQQVATMVNEDRLPDPIPVAGAQIVQVVDDQRRVIGGSATADRLIPLLSEEQVSRALTGDAVLVDGVRVGIRGPLRAQALRADPPGLTAGPVSVIVALPYGDALATRRALRDALLITYPVLLLALGTVAWRVIGWTLRPVEALRTGAEQISRGPTSAAAQRLPVPQAADEIRALAVTLNEMLDRLADSRARQRTFIADAAHELRSPLTSIRAQLEVAERLGEAGDLPTQLLADVDRLTALVEDLLLLARVDADVRPPQVAEPVDLSSLASSVARGRREGRVPVRVLAGPLAVVEVDEQELRRVLENLLTNAERHARSQVTVTTSTAAGNATLVVTDDGPGVPADQRERVFERFTRLDDARARDSGGSGLGLSIVRELVRRAGGQITLGQAAEGGLRAEVRLPLASGDDAERIGPVSI